MDEVATLPGEYTEMQEEGEMSTTGAGHSARAMLVLLAALTAASCSGNVGRTSDPFTAGTRAGTGQIQVQIQNLNFNDANVYAIRQGQRIRLGTVTGKSDKDFTMDWSFALPLRFEIQLIGGQSCRVREIMVDPGDALWVRVPSELSITPCRGSKR